MVQKRNYFAILVPFSVLFLSVFFAGVNVPHWDEWDAWMAIVPLLTQQELSWDYLWQSHNGHRFPITRLMFALFSKLHLGPKSLMVFDSSLWAANLTLFWLIARDKFSFITPRYLFATSALLLSFCQREVFFFSMNIHFSLSVFSLFLFARNLQANNLLGLTVSLLLAFISFSTWVCLVPLLLLSSCQKNKIGISQKAFYLSLVAASVVAGYFYFIGAPGEFVFQNSFGILMYLIRTTFVFLRTLGSPFVMTGKYQNFLFHGIAIGLGVLYILLFVFALRKLGETEFLRSPLIVSLCVFFTVLLVSFGRGSYGIDAIGQASRYTSFVIPGWCCIILTLLSRSAEIKWVHRMVNGLLIIGLFTSAVNLLGEVTIRRPKMLRAQSVIRAVASGDTISGADVEALAAVYPDSQRPIEIIQKLRTKYEVSEFGFMFD